jgi:ABC-2 type transport system ATP-binding protein
VSLLLTTHHLEEAEARCSRTAIIDHGRVIAGGTLSELVDQTRRAPPHGHAAARRARHGGARRALSRCRGSAAAAGRA